MLISTRRILFRILPLFLLLWALSGYAVQNSEKDQQVQKIDQQIEELQEMRRGFEARALRHEDQADRLQFDDQTYLEMRRHNQLAAENRAKAAAVQKEIERLQQKRAKILNQ